jgi:hypothetical protein
MLRIALFALALLAIAAPARAQIVDVQTLIGHDVPEGVSGKLDASVDWRTGNSRLFHTAGAVVGRWRDHDHLLFAVVRGEYDESAGLDAPLVTDVAKDFEHVRYRYRIEPWLESEAFVQHEADRFRRLQLRALAGAGLRARVAHCGQTWSIHVAAAYMAEYEELTNDMLPDAGTHATDSRLSTYATASWKLNEDVTASETVYAQPRFTDPRDLRLLEEASLQSKLASHVSFRFSLIVAHDSRPPAGTAKTDTALQSGVQISF